MGHGVILDRVLPQPFVAIDESVVVDARPGDAWTAVRELDLMRVRTPLLTASMWVRGLPARFAGRDVPPPPELKLTGTGTPLPGWVHLGETDDEICLGAVGRFWTPTIEWRDVDAADFPGFAEPTWGKIAFSISVRPYGEQRSLVTYDCRTATFDDASARAFARYWHLIRRFVGHIMRATLATIRTDAERRIIPAA